MASFLAQAVDYDRHNEEVRRVMESYAAGKPVRVPVKISGSITNFFFNPELNTEHWTFERFFREPEIQMKAQLAYQYWCRHHLLCDNEMGLPAEWRLTIDLQNSYDASWAGAPVRYIENQLPDTLTLFAEDKNKLYELPKILPVEGGLIGDGIAFIDELESLCRNAEFHGRPVKPPAAYPGEGTDGVLDMAYKLRGAENTLIDMLSDENYFHDLMGWITDNLIHRMQTLRERHLKRWGGNPKPKFYFADDAIAMISHEQYREYVLPYHKRVFEAFGNGQKAFVHLCGANMHHYQHLVEELPIDAFDTGFPIDHGLLRRQVGPDVTLQTGPTVMLVKDGSVPAIQSEVKRILQSGVTEGGKYIMIAANNMAPRTPVEHVAALYEAVRAFGVYPIQG